MVNHSLIDIDFASIIVRCVSEDWMGLHLFLNCLWNTQSSIDVLGASVCDAVTAPTQWWSIFIKFMLTRRVLTSAWRFGGPSLSASPNAEEEKEDGDEGRKSIVWRSSPGSSRHSTSLDICSLFLLPAASLGIGHAYSVVRASQGQFIV